MNCFLSKLEEQKRNEGWREKEFELYSNVLPAREKCEWDLKPPEHKEASGFVLSPKASRGPTSPIHQTSLGISESYQDYIRILQLPPYNEKRGKSEENLSPIS